MQNLIKTFNTGVGYTPEGQRIAYMPLAHRGDSTTLVAMVDADRGIDYVLAVAYPYDDAAVLDAYLNNRTEGGMWLPRAVRDLLHAAALAHGKEAPMTSHNFHTDCPAAWRYVGDVNIEYGGTFFKVADLEAFAADPVANDSVEIVRVEDTPWGWWLIESASLYLPKGRTLGAEGLAREYGLNLADLEADPLALAQLEAEFVLSVWGLEDPARMAVLIGAAGNLAERDMFGDWHLVKNGLQPTPPLTKLPGNARLANYVRANYLKV